MTIGIFYDNKHLDKIDYRNILFGNIGIGGTEYLFMWLTASLLKYHDVVVYSVKPIFGLKCTNIIKTSIKESLIEYNSLYPNGVFIMNIIYFHEIDKTFFACHLFVWHHIVSVSNAKLINKHNNKKIINILLTKQMKKDYCRYLNVLKNSVIIPNPSVSSDCLVSRDITSTNVSYIGCITPVKNVHILLLAWKKVINVIKGAHLTIVGAASLYGRDVTLGTNAISNPSYEKVINRIISACNLQDSVSFVGLKNNVEIESEIIPITKVGIVNPGFFGMAETFCLSAIQFGSFGVPVIGGDNGALRYTIPRGCGYRNKSVDDLSKKIIKLLSNKVLNNRLGDNYKSFVTKQFASKLVLDKWLNIIDKKVAINKLEIIKIPLFCLFNKVEYFINVIRQRKYNCSDYSRLLH